VKKRRREVSAPRLEEVPVSGTRGIGMVTVTGTMFFSPFLLLSV